MLKDLLKFFNCCIESLNKTEVKLNDKKSVCIVLCSKVSVNKKKVEIQNLDLSLKENKNIFLRNKIKNNMILASGGRVLKFVSKSNDFKNLRDYQSNKKLD